MYYVTDSLNTAQPLLSYGALARIRKNILGHSKGNKKGNSLHTTDWTKFVKYTLS